MINSLPAPHPDLFTLRLTVREFRHAGGIYENVTFILFKVDYQDLDLDYADLIEAPQPQDEAEVWSDYHYAKDFINADLFTAEEVEQVRRNFSDDEFATVAAEWYRDFPIGNTASVGAVAVGGYTDFYMFSETRNFDSSVKFWGFYDVKNRQKIATLKTVHCRPSGHVVFDGPNGFTLTGKDVDALHVALGEAVITEQVQTLELRLPVSRTLRTATWSELDEDLPF